MSRKRYALIGTGERGLMYFEALVSTYPDVARLVALCDTNQARMGFFNRRGRDRFQSYSELNCYYPGDLERLILETKPDTVIITSPDHTHDDYIARVMKAGCDVIAEKPVTVTADGCQRIVDTVQETGQNIRVAFNARYMPRNSKVKEIIRKGEIGEVLSIHYEELLDTHHGADFFRRWHREKEKSGGLLIHKATHHFDLVNWWLDCFPEVAYAVGGLQYYGRENLIRRYAGVDPEAKTSLHSETRKRFYLDMERSPNLREMFLSAKDEDGYDRNQDVFGDGITIEDTLAVVVRYENRAVLTYSLNTHCPWEGDRISINGSKGRLEIETVMRPHLSDNEFNHPQGGIASTNPSARGTGELKLSRPGIVIQKHWERAQEVAFEQPKGNHEGGDVRIFDDMFRGVSQDPLGRAAGYMDGIISVLVGVAANRSLSTGKAVEVMSQIKLPQQ